ncbi:NAD-dependent succinate-semialdehyde dehydrogenase [Undibacterium terreum]|uniref:NAD-dependent succinate-semialdehyde dehydrogenase n=1 Tax=Undibacterium terreum TaxID=1224302 RepID=A0A916UJQ2_9BURK|nr:NAD-dependent succinate-semialdehyde dehydrogenase [Undibacterium terreum]GGC75626.1 NAD-dependent succinate-semialdehyde dehydrogenase [Undibacterium terreum]
MNLKDISLFRKNCLIDGTWQDADDASNFPVIDPANGTELCSVPNMSSVETQRAITAAKNAWPTWRKKPAKERANILRNWFNLIVANADDLGMLMTREQGKPLAEARGEAIYAASFVEWFAEEGKRLAGDVFEAPQTDKRIVVLRESIGVCVAITPWNFPAAMITRKVAPALAAGCTMIIKPAEQTPLTALALCELAVRAGVPPGVINILTCDIDRVAEVGKTLTSSDIVRKISFTGSTEIGRLLMRQSADTIKKLSFELGGNAPFIVFDDCDIDAAVEGAMQSKFRNAGQTCVCANRIYVQSGIYDQFAEKLAARVSQLKVGNGLEKGSEIGPLIDLAAIDKVQDHIADALSKGASLLVGGKSVEDEKLGYFFQPSVLVNATQEMKIAREETFGPVAPLFKFETEEEVIAAANDTEFGLASYCFSNNIKRVWRMMEALEYGIVGVNTGIFANEVGPFGGMKQSGLGREGSVYGIDEYTELKYCCLGGFDTP